MYFGIFPMFYKICKNKSILFNKDTKIRAVFHSFFPNKNTFYIKKGFFLKFFLLSLYWHRYLLGNSKNSSNRWGDAHTHYTNNEINQYKKDEIR